ncbi:MAG: hypothetical protein R6U50_02675 [Desulfobacterales bacterium]
MKTKPQSPNFAATMMGAVPYRDKERALDAILKNFPEAPCLPIMTRGIRWVLEGMPCMVINREKREILLDASPGKENEILEFYDRFESGDLDYFATTPETAPFFYAMIERLKTHRPSELKWVVLHTVGPLLLGDMLKQPDGTPSIHHETLRDILIKCMNMKTRWLEKKLKEEIPEIEVVADLPETTLVNFTSAGGTGNRQEIIEAVDEGFSKLTCLTWIHCCANIDWSLLTDTKTDIINFDAYQHSDKVVLYAKDFKNFIDRGGMIGWGIVPVVPELLEKETVQSLVERLEQAINSFAQKGIDEKKLASASWILPCCDAVMLTADQTDVVFQMTKQISEALRKTYGF